MVLLHASPPTSPSTTTCYTEYAHIVSMKELDSNLAMLCNCSQSSSNVQRRQTIASRIGGMMLATVCTATTTTTTTTATTTFDVSNQSGVLITPPATPDIAQSNVLHRWSASSISSISSRGSAKTQQSSSSLYKNQQSSSSTSLNLCFGESDKPNPKISTNTSTGFLDLAEVMRAATSSSATGSNVVPIDNKIEQAMDLVKTHLTFAVREEVEILRSTIVELEAKVAQLESQNQVLKQFAPAEVVNSLSALVQQQQQQRQLQLQQQQQQQQQQQPQQQQHISSGATSPNPTQPISVQNMSISNQGTQKQSMPMTASEISTGTISLSNVVPSVGLLSEVQPGIEQKQSKQFSATGNIDSDMQ